jgi:sigma-B regulation protein RsbU (phosphoserine phosphatase)
MPLGLVEDQEYAMLEPLPLDPGDILVLLTDGILEATSPQGESFGWQRALDAVQRSREKAARDICEDLMGVVSGFCGGAEVADDRTVLVVKVTH